MPDNKKFSDSPPQATTRKSIRSVMKRFRPPRKALLAAALAAESSSRAATAPEPAQAAPSAAGTRISSSWRMPEPGEQGVVPVVEAPRFELRLAASSERWRDVERFVAGRSGRRTRQTTLYFDTPDSRLAQSGVTLALRREQGLWAQILDEPAIRKRHAVRVADVSPAIELGRHSVTPLGKAASRSVIESAGPLSCRLLQSSDHVRRVSHRPAGAVELEFVRARIRATGARAATGVLALRGADPDAVIALARSLSQRFCMWLEPPSTLLRWLRNGLASKAATGASPLLLAGTLSPEAALAAMVANCTQQIVPNLAELAAGLVSTEHVHQARVGIRRLRATLRTFGKWSGDVNPAWESSLARLFRSLGVLRDRDVLLETVLPSIVLAGAPPIQLSTGDGPDAPLAATLRRFEVTSLLLELQSFVWAHRAKDAGGHRAQSLQQDALAEIKRMRAQLRRDANRFARADIEHQHRTRKRLKRLRYCTELTESLFPRREIQRFLDGLRPAQNSLGRYTDLLLAEDQLQVAAQEGPGRWFALGWIAARRPLAMRAAAKALRRGLKVTPSG